jgi:hypothetical protein
MKLYVHTFTKDEPQNLETGILEFKKHEGTLQDLIREVTEVLPVKNLISSYL